MFLYMSEHIIINHLVVRDSIRIGMIFGLGLNGILL